MAEKKKVLNEIENYVPPDATTQDCNSMAELDEAVIDYTLELIEETKKVNANEKHKITEEITRLYSVIKIGWQPQI